MLLKCIEVPVLPKLWIYAQLRTLKQEVNDNFGMRCCWLGLVSFFFGGGGGRLEDSVFTRSKQVLSCRERGINTAKYVRLFFGLYYVS